MISVSLSQWLKAEERKSLSQSTVTENPRASMAWYNETPGTMKPWYNETPVQSTPGKDLINLSPSVVHKKGSVGKNWEKDSFLTFLAGSALWGWVWRLWGVPEKIWLELSPTSAALPFTWALQSPRLATQIYTKDKEQVNLRSLPFETCKKDNLTRPR